MRGAAPIVTLLCLGLLAASSRAADSYGLRAELLTQDIHERFWDDRERTYLDRHPRGSEGLPHSTMWGLGIQFEALCGGARHDEARYRPLMGDLFDGLERYYNGARKMYSAYLGGTMDIYYEDNHWMALDFIEAYEVTGSARYLEKAEEILEGCLTGVDEVRGGGSYWHIDREKHPTKNTCSNAPSATALLRICRHVKSPGKRRAYAEQGREVLAWTRRTLQGRDGIMWDSIRTDTGEVNRDWKFTYNTALVMRALLELHRQAGDGEHLAEARRMGAASSRWLRSDGPGAGRHYHDASFFTVHLVEALLELHEVAPSRELLGGCRRTADYYWRTWYRGKPGKLIDFAAVARMQWVLARYEGEPLPASRRSRARAGGRSPAGMRPGPLRGRYVRVEIDAIRVWNRTDAFPERLAGARVLVLDAERRPPWRATIDRVPRPDVVLGVKP